VAAVRCTAKGNLVVTGGPSVSPQLLHAATPHSGKAIAKAFQLKDSPLRKQGPMPNGPNSLSTVHLSTRPKIGPLQF